MVIYIEAIVYPEVLTKAFKNTAMMVKAADLNKFIGFVLFEFWVEHFSEF